jgi:hypothetical protein
MIMTSSFANSRIRLWLGFIALGSSLALTNLAQAQSTEPRTETAPTTESPPNAERAAHAEALKVKGDTLFRNRNYVEAISAYDESYELIENPRVLYNKARALQALGRYADAFTTIKRFEAEAPPELKAQVGALNALIAELWEHVSEVSVNVNVPGARVTLGNAVLGNSPLPKPVLQNAGPLKLRVVKDGYFDFEREVSLRGGSSSSFDVTLESKARFAKVVIGSKIKGTTISVDGRNIGQVPTEAVIPPGTHQIVARRDGYTDMTRQIIVEAGQHRDVTLDPIEKHRAFYERWWFWGGVGVVAAATATTVVLLSREPDKTEGDFSPSAISAPLTRF